MNFACGNEDREGVGEHDSAGERSVADDTRKARTFVLRLQGNAWSSMSTICTTGQAERLMGSWSSMRVMVPSVRVGSSVAAMGRCGGGEWCAVRAGACELRALLQFAAEFINEKGLHLAEGQWLLGVSRRSATSRAFTDEIFHRQSIGGVLLRFSKRAACTANSFALLLTLLFDAVACVVEEVVDLVHLDPCLLGEEAFFVLFGVLVFDVVDKPFVEYAFGRRGMRNAPVCRVEFSAVADVLSGVVVG